MDDLDRRWRRRGVDKVPRRELQENSYFFPAVGFKALLEVCLEEAPRWSAQLDNHMYTVDPATSAVQTKATAASSSLFVFLSREPSVLLAETPP